VGDAGSRETTRAGTRPESDSCTMVLGQYLLRRTGFLPMAAPILPDADAQRKLPPAELWPKLTVPKEYDANLPASFNLASEVLDRNLTLGRRNKVAIFHDDQRHTYGDLVRASNRLASALVELGVKPFDRVALRFPNIPEAIIANFGVLKAGALPVTVHPRWSRKEIAYVLNDSDAVYLLTHARADILGEVEAAKPEFRGLKNIVLMGDEKVAGERGYISYEDLVRRGKSSFTPIPHRKNEAAFILYTSGTTGSPKGVIHTLQGVLAVTDSVGKAVWKFEEGDVLGTPAPLTFALGYGALALIPYRFGVSVSLMTRPDPEYVLSMIEKHGVTVFTTSPTFYRATIPLLDQLLKKYDIKSLRLCTGGGEAVGPDTIERWRQKTGLTIYEGFGATEVYYIVISNAVDSEQAKPGSVGKPIPGVEVRVLDPETKEIKTSGEGQLLIGGPTGTVYWNPYANDERLLKKMKDDVKFGYVALGDSVRIDEGGRVWFVGRGEDVIKSSGYRIGPDEIEAALLGHPAVADAGVVGIPEPVRGEDVVAFVVLKKGQAPGEPLKADIQAHLLKEVAKYKLPREIFFVEALPRTLTGKLLRKELREVAKKQAAA
jgi:2-aminobenzoate-CoA ligase